MMDTRVLATSITIAASAFSSGASAQDYPSKTVRFITAQAGGGTDFMARLIAQGIAPPLGQPVIVENRPTLIAIEVVAKAPPDGYALSVASTLMWTTPLLRETPWDPIRDFAPIMQIGFAPHVLIVHPSLPINSVKELIALAKKRPGELHYQYSGAGGSSHLGGELFKSMADVNITSVPYQGSSAGLTALMSGEVQMGFENAITAIPLVKGGKVKALAIATLQPSALAPGMATVAASGLPGFQSGASYGVLAPAKTAAPVIRRLSQEMMRFVNTPETKQKILATGADAVGGSPEDFTALIKSEMARLGKVIKDVGVKAN